MTHEADRYQQIIGLAAERWPVNAPTTAGYAKLYKHHEQLIDALQYLLHHVSATVNTINAPEYCEMCYVRIGGIPKLKDGRVYCEKCYGAL